MNKILKFSAISAVSLGLAFSVFAQSPSPTPNREEMMENAKKEMEEMRETAKEQMEQQREAAKQRMEQQREEMKQKMEQEREAFKDKMEQQREELKDRIAAKRAELKGNLQKIKDERKKGIVERIDKMMDDLNSRIMEQFTKALDKLEEILGRISERADKVALEEGVNVSAVKTAIENARSAITDARKAIEVQSGKTYVIDVNTDTTLKPDVGKARQLLHSDLKEVFDKVKAARDAVHQAALTLAGLRGTATPTPTPTATLVPTTTP